jgi:hypothetical protein
MQELNPCRQIILLKSQTDPKLRFLVSVEENLKSKAWGTGDLSSRIENSRGQLWKRLWSTKDCNPPHKKDKKRNTFGLRYVSLPIQAPF